MCIWHVGIKLIKTDKFSLAGDRTDAMFRRYSIVDEGQKREALSKTQQHVAATAATREVISMKGKSK